jgi:hypothetical protein
MKHWVGHIRGTGYTTYEALNILHMKHWVGHIRGTGYTTYGALGRPHKRHWIYYIWSTGYTTYEALGGAVGLILPIWFLFCTFATKFDGALGKS